MSVTTEEKKEIIQGILHGDLWPSDCKRPLNKDGSINCFENQRALTEAFDANLKGKSDLTFDEYFQQFYGLIINLRNSGALIRETIQQVAPEAPKDEMPWPDEPSLKNITGLDIATRVDMLKKFMQPGMPLQKYNDRLAWLQRNEVFVAPDVDEEPSVRVRVAPVHAKLTRLYELIDKTGKDYNKTTINLRDRLKRQISEMVQDRKSLETIETHVKAKIRDFETGSIS